MYGIYFFGDRSDPKRFFDYSYYTGEIKSSGGIAYPVCFLSKSSIQTKQYVSEARARNAAQKLSKRCGYVTGFKIEQL